MAKKRPLKSDLIGDNSKPEVTFFSHDLASKLPLMKNIDPENFMRIDHEITKITEGKTNNFNIN